ncbi:hypothetical protein E4198_14015 [Streptomyces sp. RKND-216]|nr:hypothetical protein E4198_14015 [Streptomyces sp. RKND-216]
MKASVKFFYRLVYWKRRLLGAGRRPGSGHVPSYGPSYGSPYGRGSRAAARRARMQRIRVRARPVLVFAVIVGIVLAVSALFGGVGGVGLL